MRPVEAKLSARAFGTRMGVEWGGGACRIIGYGLRLARPDDARSAAADSLCLGQRRVLVCVRPNGKRGGVLLGCQQYRAARQWLDKGQRNTHSGCRRTHLRGAQWRDGFSERLLVWCDDGREGVLLGRQRWVGT